MWELRTMLYLGRSLRKQLKRASVKPLPRKTVSEEVEARICNSVHLRLPQNKEIVHYRNGWQYIQKQGRRGVSCPIIFEKPNGELVTITVSCLFNSQGIVDSKLWLEPIYLDGKKIWLKKVIIQMLIEEAKEAYQRISPAEKQ